MKLKKIQLGLRTFCQANLSPQGYVTVTVKDVKGHKDLNLYVVDVDREPLLGREWINQLQKLKSLRKSLEDVESINSLEDSRQTKLDALLKKL